jgi:hypothetical protein
MLDMLETPNFQFIHAQIQMLLTSKNNLRYSKHVMILAAELLCVSPAAYRMLRRSGVINLPREQTVRDLMTRSLDDQNLTAILQELQPQQRLLNILFDEVKLRSSLRFTAGHIMGHAQNVPDQLSSSALCFEAICHHGGPRFIIRVVPVTKLNSKQLQCYLLEAVESVVKSGGCIISIVCDNCPINQSLYSDLGGPGPVNLPCHVNKVFLVYDYVHIFKNLRNNWITEPKQELHFTEDGHKYVALWRDVKALYEDDRMTAVRLTKLTHTSVHPKILQRQSVPLVCQVFNE